MPHIGSAFRGPQDLGAQTLVAAPGVEPITVIEAKSHLRVDISDDDGIIGDYITAARLHVEDLTSKKLITQTWKLILDRFPWGRTIELPFGPVQSVTSVKFTDQAGVQATQTASEYVVDVMSERARIVLKDSFDWPDPDGDLQEANAVEIEFIVGYGAAGSDVPQNLRHAVRMLVGHMYENREAVALRPGSTFEVLPMGFSALIAPFRLYARRI